MKAFIILLSIPAHICFAGGLGPSSPASLLPPINSSKNGPLTAAPPKAEPSPDFDPIFDLEDPSTLLEQDERALSANEPANLTGNTGGKLPDKPTSLNAYDKKLLEASQRLLGPRDAKIRPLPPLDPKRRLIPLLPATASKTEGETSPSFYPTAPAQPKEPPHPPLLSAMNPPPQKQAPYIYPDFALNPMLAGLNVPPPVERQPTGGETVQAPPPAQVTPLLPVPKTTALAPMNGVPDVAIILSNNQFFPSKIRLKEGTQTRLIFTTTNKKPAALIMEKLQIQRWIAKEKEPVPASELERAKWEVNRELSASKVTEVVLDPKPGTYTFHDAISGASGEIEVEKK